MNIILFSISILSLTLLSPPASAYFDPGTTSIVLQAVLAGIATGLAWASFYWEKVKSFLRAIFSREKKEDKNHSNGDK